MPESRRDFPPAFVISLDFELHWGVRDIYRPDDAYGANLRGAREAIPKMLELFARYDIAATWATVGFLFARTRDELESFSPSHRPQYTDANLDPYKEPLGWDENDDPSHFAPGIVDTIAASPRQEIATHTWSHYYCIEAGADLESFRQDLESALSIARSRGIEMTSIVLPRNQWNPEFENVLRDVGINCVRGPQPGWMYRPIPEAQQTLPRRVARLFDSHLPVTPWAGAEWSDLQYRPGLVDVPASAFLRPATGRELIDRMRLRRLMNAMSRSAEAGRIFHLWWHPHNFGVNLAENLTRLRSVLEHVRSLHDQFGLQSMTMKEIASRVLAVPHTSTTSETHV